MRNILLLSFALILLSGCSLTQERDVEVKRVYISIPEALTEQCIPERPLSNEEYKKLMDKEREVALGLYTLQLFNHIAKCNIKLIEIRKLLAEQQKNKEIE